ncbi:MAG TPA: hypothetical protein VFK15_04850, partial [Burkholderiales bacterium]|nr:hypothetical protein [Burkholderiales bacterium]
LAYAVGFGGSMIWFGSSAGVALSNMYPEARSVAAWLRHGWHVALAYVVGFVVLLGTLGWEPHERVRSSIEPGTIVANAEMRASVAGSPQSARVSCRLLPDCPAF